MSEVLHHKVVAALPSPLEPDSIYYVRVGAGFDIYVTNSLGVIASYPLNAEVASGEWDAVVVSQAEAQAGTATTARKWTSQRVRQAIARTTFTSGASAQNVTSSRALNTNYTNTTGRPIIVAYTQAQGGLASIYLGTGALVGGFANPDGLQVDAKSTVVPAGAVYRITDSSGVKGIWLEYR